MHVHFLSPVVNYYFNKDTSCHFFTWASNCKHTSVLIVGHHPTDGKKILEWEPGSRLASKAQGGFVGQRHGAMACDSVKSPIMAWDLPNQPSNQPVGPKILHRYGYTSYIPTKWGCLLFGLPGLPYQNTNIVGSRNLLNAEWLHLEVPVRFRMTQPNSSLTSWMLLETSRPMGPMAGRDQTCVCYG